MYKPAAWFALVSTAVLFAACERKVVGPEEAGRPATGDEAPPKISGLQPATAGAVLNDTEVRFQVTDPPLPGGSPGSGVDAASVRVVLQGGSSLPVTQQGSTFIASIASLDEGPTLLDVSVRDRAGNEAAARFDFILDRTPPVANLVATSRGPVMSGEWSVTLGLAGSVADPNGFPPALTSVAFTIAHPGINGTCEPEDAPFEAGTVRGKVTENRFALRDAAERFDVRPRAINATSGPDDTPRTVKYCGVFRAVDSARDAAGSPAGNVLFEVFEYDVTWLPFPFPGPDDVAGRWIVRYGHRGDGFCSNPRTWPQLAPELGAGEAISVGPDFVTFIDARGSGEGVQLQAVLPGGSQWLGADVSGIYDRMRGQFTGVSGEADFSGDWYDRYRTWGVRPKENWEIAFDGPATAPFFIGRSQMEWSYDMAEFFDDEWGAIIPAHSVNCRFEVLVMGEKLP